MNETDEKKLTPAEAAKLMRKKRARSLLIKFSLGVLLPTLISVFYYAFIASDIYESISSITVQSSNMRPTIGIEALIGGISNSGSRDALTVQEYIRSRDMLSLLDKKYNLLNYYKNKKIDYFSRLADDASFEKGFKFYNDHILVEFDALSGVLTLTVQAFDPETAQKLSLSIIEYSEQMVNSLSERAQKDQIAFARQEVDKAEQRLAEAQKAVLELQEKSDVFHPGAKAKALQSVSAQLEATLAQTRAELSQAQSVMAPSSPKVITLRQKVRALKHQIKMENKRLVGEGSKGLNQSMAAFESAMLEKGFAEKEYKSAVASMEMSKINAARQSRYLATIAVPSVPDEATRPKRILKVITVFFVSLAFFSIGMLIISAIREHARI
jgi:capsular polysaccharide transport system permease protein